MNFQVFNGRPFREYFPVDSPTTTETMKWKEKAGVLCNLKDNGEIEGENDIGRLKDLGRHCLELLSEADFLCREFRYYNGEGDIEAVRRIRTRLEEALNSLVGRLGALQWIPATFIDKSFLRNMQRQLKRLETTQTAAPHGSPSESQYWDMVHERTSRDLSESCGDCSDTRHPQSSLMKPSLRAYPADPNSTYGGRSRFSSFASKLSRLTGKATSLLSAVTSGPTNDKYRPLL